MNRSNPISGNDDASRYTPTILGSSIVVVGQYNPAGFSPDWLLSNQLIGSEDRDFAVNGKPMVISNTMSVWETNWFQLQALAGQLSISSKGALTPLLKDLARNILLITTHTDIAALGINFYAHYKIENLGDWHRVGDSLAPKKIWTKLFDPLKYSCGMADVQIRVDRGTRAAPTASEDKINVQVQPSIIVQPGIYIMYNDHRVDFTHDKSGGTVAERAAGILDGEWESTWKFAERTFNLLLTEATASGAQSC